MSATKAVPKPTMITSGITPTIFKGVSGSMRGKGGSTSGGTMTGCTACGKGTKAVPAPKA